jgi:hypothetical protein
MRREKFPHTHPLIEEFPIGERGSVPIDILSHSSFSLLIFMVLKSIWKMRSVYAVAYHSCLVVSNGIIVCFEVS